MKYHLHEPLLQIAVADCEDEMDKDAKVKALLEANELKMIKKKAEIEGKNALSKETIEEMKRISTSLGGVKENTNKGVNIEFEDFKRIETCMI